MSFIENIQSKNFSLQKAYNIWVDSMAMQEKQSEKENADSKR